jgi:hypothetical protein
MFSLFLIQSKQIKKSNMKNPKTDLPVLIIRIMVGAVFLSEGIFLPRISRIITNVFICEN